MPDWVIWSGDNEKATLAVISVANLYVDPCDPTLQLQEPSVGPSVDDLVAALDAVPAWEVSTPVDVTVGGVAGMYVEYVSSAPTGDCADPQLWQLNGGGAYPDQPAPTQGDIVSIWILDADGERVVITTRSSSAVPDFRLAELDAMIDSIQIE